jgi:adenosine deaminase
MCQGPMHAFLKAVPKCEHHMHLEGSLEPSLLFQLAKENGIHLPSDEDPAFASVDSLLERYKHFTSLDDFLHYYFIGMSALRKQSDFEALAWQYFVRAKADGVIHAEVFFDIICFLRHMPVSIAEATYQTALPDLKSGRLSGIGLSSTEKGNPPNLFKSIYASAEAEGIRRTAHAGEEADVSYMRDALESLHIQRADHGIKLVDDLSLMADYVKNRILITMCPLSNLRLQCVKDIKELPIRAYLNNRVRFSINSDDPAYFGGYILDNYCAVQEAFELDVEEWTSIIMASIQGSWCSEARKDEMFAIYADVLEEVSRPSPPQ